MFIRLHITYEHMRGLQRLLLPPRALKTLIAYNSPTFTLFPHMQIFLKLWLSLLNVIGGIVLLGMKAYLLSMVWLCYKFLMRYRAGSEPSSGFAISADSCIVPLRLCRRCGCCICIPVLPITNVLVPDFRSTAVRITSSASPTSTFSPVCDFFVINFFLLSQIQFTGFFI